jgi:hypothetical protein
VGAVVVVLDPEESAEELGSTTSKTPYGIWRINQRFSFFLLFVLWLVVVVVAAFMLLPPAGAGSNKLQGK